MIVLFFLVIVIDLGSKLYMKITLKHVFSLCIKQQ